jgi:hypothetical protein
MELGFLLLHHDECIDARRERGEDDQLRTFIMVGSLYSIGSFDSLTVCSMQLFEEQVL